MNNVVYSILPFILFGFICAVLTRRRFSKKVTTAVWIAVMAVLAGVHLGVGLASYDSSVIIALMPVTAYLPVIIALSFSPAGAFRATSSSSRWRFWPTSSPHSCANCA